MTREKAVRYDLGEEARAHLHEKLERWGYHVVTAAIKEQLDLSQGGSLRLSARKLEYRQFDD